MRINLEGLTGAVRNFLDESPSTTSNSKPNIGSPPLVNPKAVEHFVATTSIANSPVWTPENHDRLLEEAFPGLERGGGLLKMKHGSRSVDAKLGVLPITLIESQAPKHAMTPGYKVREFMRQGMSREQAVEKAREWAFGEAKSFVDSKGEEAKRLQVEYERQGGSGLSPKALYVFGEGAHTLMDNTSPVHRGFQVYDLEEYLSGDGSVFDVGAGMDVIGYAADMLRHKGEESHVPTAAETKETTEALHKYFRNVFGADALQAAMSKPPRGPVPSPHPTPVPRS